MHTVLIADFEDYSSEDILASGETILENQKHLKMITDPVGNYIYYKVVCRNENIIVGYSTLSRAIKIYNSL